MRFRRVCVLAWCSSSGQMTMTPNCWRYLYRFRPGGFRAFMRFLYRTGRSTACWCGALGPQNIECPTARTLDSQLFEFSLAQLARASPTTYFHHCKHLSPVVTRARLARLRTWRVSLGFAGGSCLHGGRHRAPTRCRPLILISGRFQANQLPCCQPDLIQYLRAAVINDLERPHVGGPE